MGGSTASGEAGACASGSMGAASVGWETAVWGAEPMPVSGPSLLPAGACRETSLAIAALRSACLNTTAASCCGAGGASIGAPGDLGEAAASGSCSSCAGAGGASIGSTSTSPCSGSGSGSAGCDAGRAWADTGAAAAGLKAEGGCSGEELSACMLAANLACAISDVGVLSPFCLPMVNWMRADSGVRAEADCAAVLLPACEPAAGGVAAPAALEAPCTGSPAAGLAGLGSAGRRLSAMSCAGSGVCFKDAGEPCRSCMGSAGSSQRSTTAQLIQPRPGPNARIASQCRQHVVLSDCVYCCAHPCRSVR